MIPSLLLIVNFGLNGMRVNPSCHGGEFVERCVDCVPSSRGYRPPTLGLGLNLQRLLIMLGRKSGTKKKHNVIIFRAAQTVDNNNPSSSILG